MRYYLKIGRINVKLLNCILLVLLLPSFAVADLVCGRTNDTYYFEFLNHGQFQTPTAYMVDIYVKGQLWKQEAGLSYPVRGKTDDGYQFGIIKTKVGPKHNYQVKIQSKNNKHVLLLVNNDEEAVKIPCIVKHEEHDYKPRNQNEKYDVPLKSYLPDRMPASDDVLVDQ